MGRRCWGRGRGGYILLVGCRFLCFVVCALAWLCFVFVLVELSEVPPRLFFLRESRGRLKENHKRKRNNIKVRIVTGLKK